MLNLITKIGIYNPDTNEEVVLTNIMEGVDGAASFSYQEEPGSVMIEDGQTLDHSITGTLDIKVLRVSDDDLAIIDSVVGKRAYVAGITLNGFLVFSGLHYINRVPDFNSSIINDQIRLTVTRQKGYYRDESIGATAVKGFYGGLNAMMRRDVLNGYTTIVGANNVLGGLEPIFSTADYTVSGREQTIVTTAAGSGGLRTPFDDNPFYFPFTDHVFTFSVGYVSATGSANLEVRILGKDTPSSGSSNSVVSEGNSGRISATWNWDSVRSTKRFFTFQIGNPSSISTQTTYVFKEPALRLGTNDQFSY